MPAGRPKRGRILGKSYAEARLPMERALDWLRADPDPDDEPEPLPADLRALLIELVEHFMTLDEIEMSKLRTLGEQVASDPTIPEVTKAGLDWWLTSFERGDAATRQQLRTLIGTAITAKPPDTARAPGAGGRRVPGGASVPQPAFSAGELGELGRR